MFYDESKCKSSNKSANFKNKTNYFVILRLVKKNHFNEKDIINNCDYGYSRYRLSAQGCSDLWH